LGDAGDPLDPLGRLMLAFDGHELPADVGQRFSTAPAAGMTLFRFFNSGSPAQVRELTASVQRAAQAFERGAPPLLVAADQEGGQLDALGGATPFPGNMALGAVGDEVLAERVGRATGLELLAMGANVSYAPVCDLADNPANPHIGIRSLGSEPTDVARLAAAIVRGMRGSGIAAGGKHFPGLGGSDLDTHHELAVVAHDRARLDRAELVPFRAAIDAGAEVVMSAHLALPAVTGDASLPATLSRTVMHDLIRDHLGFRGLTITDALNMGALPQGDAQVIDVIAAIRAGVDLLLTMGEPMAQARIEGGLRHAAARGLFDADDMRVSAERIRRLRRRLGEVAQPPIEVVRSAAHEALAREVAERSITLVRDDARLLPVRLPADARVVVVQPMPRDLTPADTSSYVPPLLAAAIRRRYARTEEIVVQAGADFAAIRAAIAGADLLVLGTVSASLDPAQGAHASALLELGIPAVTVALRTPFDLAAYPSSATHVCAYGILEPTCEAVAATLFGEIPFLGHLPAPIPGLYPVGHGLTGRPTREH
jgi:beta-N-acetylhexosaminidase